MKNINFFVASILLISISSCLPPVIFTEAQPEGYPRSENFSSRYQGTFYCEGDQSIVQIKSKLITKELTYQVGIPIDDIAEMEGVEYKDNKLYIEGMQPAFDAHLENGDTVVSNIILKDTIFNLYNEEHVLSEYLGHQILNNKIQKDVWSVSILSLDYSDGIILSEVFLPEDLKKLKQITPVEELSEDDMMIIRISPTIKEFHEILQEKLIFQACDHFVRIKKPVNI